MGRWLSECGQGFPRVCVWVVPEQVDQDLAQVLLVSDHERRHRRVDERGERDFLVPAGGVVGHEAHQVPDALVQVERTLLHVVRRVRVRVRVR